MVTPVDPNEIRLTGENSFIELRDEVDGPLTTQATHWRILLSPAGAGHVLILRSELTNNEVKIYSDNIAMARWLQEEIESGNKPHFSDQNIPAAEATFSREGNVSSFYEEKIVSRDENITMTWFDFGEPYLIRFDPGSIKPDLPHGVYSVLTPAHSAQIVINGELAPGKVFTWAQGGRDDSTSCCLAWSETWVRPR